MSFDTLSPTSQTKLRVSELMIPVLLWLSTFGYFPVWVWKILSHFAILSIVTILFVSLDDAV
jgi:hypothetical protein